LDSVENTYGKTASEMLRSVGKIRAGEKEDEHEKEAARTRNSAVDENPPIVFLPSPSSPSINCDPSLF
jgi:hypothetical protein